MRPTSGADIVDGGGNALAKLFMFNDDGGDVNELDGGKKFADVGNAAVAVIGILVLDGVLVGNRFNDVDGGVSDGYRLDVVVVGDVNGEETLAKRKKVKH